MRGELPRAIAALSIGLVTVAGCASVIEGRSQRISVATNPPGARCGLYREQGIRIATVERTPGDALVEKTKADIWIVCIKQGYQPVSFRNHSGVSGAAFVNVIGGIFTLGISTAIGAAVDSSNGSDNKYQSPVTITMAANSSDQSAGQSTLPDSFDPASAGRGAQPQPATTSDMPEASGPGPVDTSASTPNAARPTPVEVASSAPRPAAARAAGTLPAAGIWECGLRNGRRTYKLQFVVGANHSILVRSYANAPATIVQNEPLTMTAVNPHGDRSLNIVWNSDNTMEITGPSSRKPDTTFRDSGACTKV